MNLGRVGVLAGGPSNEREISLRSGSAVHKALLEEGVDAVFLDVRQDIHDIIKRTRLDVAFIALHGRFGEDGTVQGILEGAGIPYTGSGVEASAAALDKIESKSIFAASGIPTPEYAVLEDAVFGASSAGRLGWPLVVKPQFEGSSIGLSVVRGPGEMDAALGKAFEYGDRIIAEKYIDGRELTVGILDEKALPIIEIVPRNKIYDYQAKYEDPDTQYLVPAPIDSAIAARASSLGERAHRSLGCRSFSRVDMMLDRKGNIFVLEVNTIPGMTERSLLPKAARAAGIGFGKLCVRIIQDAIREHHETTKKV